MTLKDANRGKIQTLFRNLPLISTDQAASVLEGKSLPKRASQILHAWEEEKLTEGRRSDTWSTTSKVWRLTKKGREEFEASYRPIPFSSPKVNHWLALTDSFIWLWKNGDLRVFEAELKESYSYLGKKKVYSPDAFFIWNQRAYLLELQLTKKSSKDWAEKWKAANEFFMEGGPYRSASFQKWRPEGHYIKPLLTVISPQRPDTIVYGASFKLKILTTIGELGC